MNITFTKMQGIGNDFIVINNITLGWKPDTDIIKKMADRHFGVGCDQLLLLEKVNPERTIFTIQIYNADGSAAKQCGNGLRCMAAFIQEEKLTTANTFDIAIADNSQHKVTIHSDKTITVDLIKNPLIEKKHSAMLDLDIIYVNLGNSHAVVLLDKLEEIPLKKWGKLLNPCPEFPEGINLGCMEIINEQTIKLRVYERGVGETLACGSGACAAVVAGQYLGKLSKTVTVYLPDGSLNVTWQSNNEPIKLTGSATTVFKGHFVT